MKKRAAWRLIVLGSLCFRLSVGLAQEPGPESEPTPFPTPVGTPIALPTPLPTPTPTPKGYEITDTDNDVSVSANGYITTFHGGKPYAVDELGATPVYSTAQLIGVQRVRVTTLGGDLVPLSPGVLFVDKNGNPVDPNSIQPGTRMQAVEVVDQVDVGLVVRKIMVDQT